MTTEVEEFLDQPDSIKAEALEKEQKLEAWDRIDEGGIPDDRRKILQDATDSYIIELANKSFDEMTPADLENIRNLMDRANPELCRNELETIKHKMDIKESHDAVDRLAAFNQREGAEQFATYMHARIDGQSPALDDNTENLINSYIKQMVSEDEEALPGELQGQIAAFQVEAAIKRGEYTDNSVDDEAVELADNTDAYMAHLDEVIEAGGEDGRKAQAFKDMLEGREGPITERLQRQTDIMDWYQQDTYAINDDGEEHPGEFGKPTIIAQKADAYLDEIAEQAQSASFQQDVAFYNVDAEAVLNYVDRLNSVMDLSQDENATEGAANLGDQFLEALNNTRAGIGYDAIVKPAEEESEDDGIIIEDEDEYEVLGDEGEELTDDTPTQVLGDDEELTGDSADSSADAGAPTDEEELADDAAAGPTGDYIIDDEPIPDMAPEEETKSPERLELEAYLATLDPTAEGFEDYKEVMLNSVDEDRELPNALKNMAGAQRFIDKQNGRAGVPDMVQDLEKKLKETGEEAIANALENKDSALWKAGISDNIEDVKTYDDFMKAFGKENGEEAIVADTQLLNEAVDNDRTNTGKMSVEEAVFLANTSEEKLKKRDEEIDALSEDLQDIIIAEATSEEAAEWQQINDFYNQVIVDHIDSANLILPDIDESLPKKKKDEATTDVTAEGATAAEGDAPETEEEKKQKKEKVTSGQDLKKDLYDLAVLQAKKDLLMDSDYDALNEEQRKKRLAALTREKMVDLTYQLVSNQFAYDAADAGHFRKHGNPLNEKQMAEDGKAMLGRLLGDPDAKGAIHIADTVAAATLAANEKPLEHFAEQLNNKIKSSALYQKVKALDTRLTKKYPKAYPIAKQIIAKAGTRLAIGWAAGPIALAAYSGIETYKACKKIRNDYLQQKREGQIKNKTAYFKKNWPKVVGAAASVVGTAVASWVGIDAVRLNGADAFGAIGHAFGGEHVASSSVGMIDAAKNLAKNTWQGTKNILTGNLHEYSARQVASLSRATMTLASGLGAASQSFAKGDWKAGWAQFGGAFAGAAIAAVMLESQAAHAAEMPAGGHTNTGSGTNTITENGGQGGATLKTNPNGLGVDPNQFKLDTPKIDGMPETPEETIAKAQETVNHANNPDFERVKPGLNGGRVDIGAKAPKIELDPDVEKVINDPNAVPQVPEGYKGNGGGQQLGQEEEVVKEDDQEKQGQGDGQGQETVVEEDEFVEVPEERLAVDLEDPKEVRVDDVPEEGAEKYKEMKIEAASNGAALEVTTPDGKSVEFVSAINEETGLRRSVMVTRDADGNVVSEQEMTDKEARRLARQLAKTDARVNGDVSDTAEKAYKTIKHASSTELHHAKPVVEIQHNEDGSQFSLTRGRNGLSGTFTQENGEQAKYSIIKSKLGGKTTVHYVVTEDNGHQRMMMDDERAKITKQIEETGDKKSIKKLHQFGKKLEYNTNQPQYTPSDHELGYTRGNTKLSMSLDENGRAQYTAMEKGRLRPATAEEIESLKKNVKDEIIKNANASQSENAAAGALPPDAQVMNRVLAAEATEKFATEKLGLDEKSLKVRVAADANGHIQASVAVSNNGALYQKGGSTTYAVLNEHKQIEAYTIENGTQKKMDLQSTANFVSGLQKHIDANSDFGKAASSTMAAASKAQSMQRA